MRHTRSNAENEAPDDASRSPIPALPLNRTAKQRRAASPSPSSSADEDGPQSGAYDDSFLNIDAAPSISASNQLLGDDRSEDEEDARRIPAAAKGKGKAVAQDLDEEDRDSSSDDEALAFLPDVGSVVYIAAEVAGCRTKGVKNGEVVDAEDDGFEYVGGFVLKEILGEGTSGCVYRARRTNDEGSDLEYAVKIAKGSSPVILDKIADEFATEFELQTAASSAHVIAAFACGRLSPTGAGGGRPFVLMEVATETLFNWMYRREAELKNQPSTFLVEAAELMRQLIVAILHLHLAGIAHRDLKPENLVIVETGGTSALKIIDFGSAIADCNTAEPEQEFECKGSFPYSGADDIATRFLLHLHRFLDQNEESMDYYASLPPRDLHRFLISWRYLADLHRQLRRVHQDRRRRDLFAFFIILLFLLLGGHGYESYFQLLQAPVDGSNAEQVLNGATIAVGLYMNVFINSFQSKKEEPRLFTAEDDVESEEEEEEAAEDEVKICRRKGYSNVAWLPSVLSLVLEAYEDEKTQYEGPECVFARVLRLIAPVDPALANFDSIHSASASTSSSTTEKEREEEEKAGVKVSAAFPWVNELTTQTLTVTWFDASTLANLKICLLPACQTAFSPADDLESRLAHFHEKHGSLDGVKMFYGAKFADGHRLAPPFSFADLD